MAAAESCLKIGEELELDMSFLRKAVDTYSRWLRVHPIKTKSLTNCGLAAAADVIVQKADGDEIDYARTARFSSYSLLFGEKMGTNRIHLFLLSLLPCFSFEILFFFFSSALVNVAPC